MSKKNRKEINKKIEELLKTIMDLTLENIDSDDILKTIVGHIDWAKGPLPNVALTLLAGAQWRPGKKYKYELEVVTSKMVPGLKTTAKVIPIPYS